jgi:hypothetical protein
MMHVFQDPRYVKAPLNDAFYKSQHYITVGRSGVFVLVLFAKYCDHFWNSRIPSRFFFSPHFLYSNLCLSILHLQYLINQKIKF